MIIHILPREGVTNTQLRNAIHKHLKKDATTWKISDNIPLTKEDGSKTITPSFKHIKPQYDNESVFFRKGKKGIYMACYPMEGENTIHMLSSMMIYTLTYHLSDHIEDINISL